MRNSNVPWLPSASENVTGVIYEALPLGAVPIAADFGEAGDAARPGTGYKTPRTAQNAIASKFPRVFLKLLHERRRPETLWRKGATYVRARLT